MVYWIVTDHGEAVPRGDELPRSISYIPYGEIFVEESDNEGVMPYFFNAKELDEETGLYYYGARHLDPTGTIWLSVDPLFEKYVGMNPYGYCAGNPVKYFDKDGRKLYITFCSTKEKDLFLDIMSSILGYSSSVSLTSVENCNWGNTFDVTLSNNSDIRFQNERTSSFYTELKSIIDDDVIVNIIAVSCDDNVDVGSFYLNQIDLMDLQEFEKSDKGASMSGALIHELKEQYAKATKGLGIGEGKLRDYKKCHGFGIVAENKVDRKKRKDGYCSIENYSFSVFTEPDGSKTRQYLYEDSENCLRVKKEPANE